MKKSSSSRDKLIAVARDLIIERGFSAMSVGAVCAAAAVTKGSFFHHFSTKEALGEAVLEQFWSDVQDRQSKASYQHAGDPFEKLLGYIDHAIEIYQDPVIRKGCLLAVFTSELRETQPNLFMKCVPHFIAWKTDLEALLQEAAAYCQPINPWIPSAWAELYISALEGALILARALNDPKVITRVLTLFRAQLSNVFPDAEAVDVNAPAPKANLL